MIVNIAWPRQSIYNPAPPFQWFLQWGGVLFVVIALGAGLIYYLAVQRHKIGILPQHAANSGQSSTRTVESGEPAI